jgi:hypothetical protein
MNKQHILNTPKAGEVGFRKTHGLRRIPEYDVWNAMKNRCHNPNSSGFYKYGARGIHVCDRWRGSFVAFYEDMGPRPSPKHSVEREDNNRGYEPSNCRWATVEEQANNKRWTVYIGGKTIAEIAKDTGLSRKTIETRYHRGLSAEEIMEKTKRRPGRKAGSKLRRSARPAPA